MADFNKLSSISETASSNVSSQTASDAGSTYSTISAATTLKGSIKATKTNGSSLRSKPESENIVENDEYVEKQAVHNEAIACYFSMR